MPRSARELLADLRADGFEFRPRPDGHLAVRRLDGGAIPPAVVDELTRHREAISRLVTAGGAIEREPDTRSRVVVGEACACPSCAREDRTALEEKRARRDHLADRWRPF